MSIFDKLRQALTGMPEVIPENAIIIDVRSPDEFANGHIEQSINIPVDQITTKISALVPLKDQPIVVYCASGMRSASARATLIKMGYNTVSNAGGLQSAASALNKKIV